MRNRENQISFTIENPSTTKQPTPNSLMPMKRIVWTLLHIHIFRGLIGDLVIIRSWGHDGSRNPQDILISQLHISTLGRSNAMSHVGPNVPREHLHWPLPMLPHCVQTGSRTPSGSLLEISPKLDQTIDSGSVETEGKL